MLMQNNMCDCPRQPVAPLKDRSFGSSTDLVNGACTIHGKIWSSTPPLSLSPQDRTSVNSLQARVVVRSTSSQGPLCAVHLFPSAIPPKFPSDMPVNAPILPKLCHPLCSQHHFQPIPAIPKRTHKLSSLPPSLGRAFTAKLMRTEMGIQKRLRSVRAHRYLLLLIVFLCDLFNGSQTKHSGNGTREDKGGGTDGHPKTRPAIRHPNRSYVRGGG